MKKKAYMYPTMLVVALKHRSLLLSGSPVVNSLGNKIFNWDSDGIEDEELDM